VWEHTSSRLQDGSEVELRSLQPNDREQLVRLFYRLSPASVYHRFLSPLHDPHELGLDRLLDIDHLDREAVAAVSGGQVVGVARYARQPGSDSADLAILVEDAWQGRGLSLVLIEQLVKLARSRGIASFTAILLSVNRVAIGMLRHAFPAATFTRDGTALGAVLPFEDSGRGGGPPVPEPPRGAAPEGR
jgi:GNAT superfamily N-acetyltransferase